MAEYIAKNLAIELMHQSSYLGDGDLLEVNGNLAKERIEAELAADVVVPVRCKDCVHHHYDGRDIPYCDKFDYGYGWKDDDFCSHGERKE